MPMGMWDVRVGHLPKLGTWQKSRMLLRGFFIGRMGPPLHRGGCPKLGPEGANCIHWVEDLLL